MRQNQFADEPKTFFIYESKKARSREREIVRGGVRERQTDREKRRGDKAEAKKFITHFRFMPRQQTK